VHKPRWGGERSPTARRGRWSTEEIARLRELYGLRDDLSISRELGRSVASVRNMARQVFERDPKRGPWSAAELEELRRYLGACPTVTLSLVLGRTQEDVQACIVELARHKQSGPWSLEELGELKRLYGSRTDEDLAILLGRRLEDVRKVAKEQCLSKDKAFLRRSGTAPDATRMPRWTAKELDLLVKLYPRHSNLEIAQRLNRSVKSVLSKAHHIGLKKDLTRLEEMGRENVSLRYRRE